MMVYTVENTVQRNRPVRLWIGGEEVREAVWALTILGFVIAVVIRKDAAGRYVLMPGNEKVATALRFGRGRVEAYG